MRAVRVAAWVLASVVGAVVASSCVPAPGGGGGGGGGDGGDDAAEAFTSSLEFDVPATPTVGDLPDGSSSGPQVIDLPGGTGAPLGASPGQGITFAVPWTGGEIASVNIGFGGSQYFNVPVPAASGKQQGVVNIPANVSADVCTGFNLSNVCHQIKCYEQVVTAAGTFSKAQAMQMVLYCNGGTDCGGNPADASTGPGDALVDVPLDQGGCRPTTFGSGDCIPAPGPSSCPTGMDFCGCPDSHGVWCHGDGYSCP